MKIRVLVLTAATLAALSLTAASAAGSEGSARADGDKRTCGLLPGEGAFSYVVAHNVSCREARKVGHKAGRKFCAEDGCSVEPDGDVHDGGARVKGWDCAVKVGYEFFQARCRKGDMSFLQRSGA